VSRSSDGVETESWVPVGRTPTRVSDPEERHRRIPTVSLRHLTEDDDDGL
jgi:hypothetical protein